MTIVVYYYNIFIFNNIKKMMMMIQERHPIFIRFIIIFISYVAVLQVLYALQNIFVSIPFVAVFTTFYILILRRKFSSKSILDYTGSNTKTNTTHERDLQNLLIQQSEGVLQTNLDQFRKVKNKQNIIFSI
jgi:hypothetical protein